MMFLGGVMFVRKVTLMGATGEMAFIETELSFMLIKLLISLLQQQIILILTFHSIRLLCFISVCKK